MSNLRYGTRQQNEADKDVHGTVARGERNGRARLTVGLVRQIRAEYAAGGATFEALALKHGVTWQQIRYIVRRERWGHVT